MSKTWLKIFGWATIADFVLTYQLWRFMWSGFFYQGMAVGILFMFILLREIKEIRVAATVGMWLAINNLSDEIFFDPKSFGWNEYVFALIIILIALIKWHKTRTRNNIL